LFVHLTDGGTHEVELPAVDKLPEFDPIYRQLRQLDLLADDMQEVFDSHWRPWGRLKR
jgi:hypothetical protein